MSEILDLTQTAEISVTIPNYFSDMEMDKTKKCEDIKEDLKKIIKDMDIDDRYKISDVCHFDEKNNTDIINNLRIDFEFKNSDIEAWEDDKGDYVDTVVSGVETQKDIEETIKEIITNSKILSVDIEKICNEYDSPFGNVIEFDEFDDEFVLQSLAEEHFEGMYDRDNDDIEQDW